VFRRHMQVGRLCTAMATSPNEDLPDLLSDATGATGGFETNNAADFHQVCLLILTENNVMADVE